MHTKEYFKQSDLRIFLGYYKPHVHLFILNMVCALVISLVDIVFPFITKYCLESVLPSSLYKSFIILISACVVLFAFRSAMYFVVTYWGHDLGVRMEADMRIDLFSHLQKLSFHFYDKNRTGSIMSRITNDLFDVTELAHHCPEDLFISSVTLIGSFIVMLTIHVKLALILFAFVPVIILYIISLRKKMRESSGNVKERTSQINADIESGISGIRVAKSFANENYELEKFKKGNLHFRYSKNFFYKVMASFHAGSEFFTGILQVVAIAAGGYYILKNELTIAELLAFNLYIATFVQPIKKFSFITEQFSSGMAGFRRFVSLMRIEPEITDAPSASDLKDVKGQIVFEHVSFSYDNHNQLIKDMSFCLHSGETLALVGQSGSGKTTVCNLILRFYEANSGKISVDGKNIKDITLHSLRSSIGLVQQDVFLFADTIAENIRYGRLDATDAEIMEAAKLAEIHEDIMAMPDKYETFVGERGVMLSGGQKQRISIARIFLKNPRILMLDEATSALDTSTEKKIQRSLERLSHGRTTLIIAHRLSTVKNADRIAVINGDGICEIGTHDALLKHNGEYAKLVRADICE